jgi:hypothetical protein
MTCTSLSAPRCILLLCTCALGLLSAFSGLAQGNNTVGVLTQSEESYDGYTLLPVTASSKTYLINNCGEVVNTWTSDYKAGMMAYLLPDGGLMRAGRTNNLSFGAGGAGGIVEKFDWEGNLVWSYLLSSPTLCQHHDIAVMPNGNVLALLWKSYPATEWIERGRDPELTSEVVWGTCIVEIVPEGPDGGEVVWKWEAIEHLVQDFDPELPNYGEPSMYPRQLDVNFAASADDRDWLHTNSIAYNEELDQIMISSRDFSEFYVLDHSVPLSETNGPGGHLLYRWGNPAAYGRGTESDRILYNQHDARWIQDGQIMVFSNGNERPDGYFSTVEVLTPPLNANGTYNLDPTAPWGPDGTDWRYPSILDADFFSQNTSGAQQLPNGNILITEGASGEIREVTLDQEFVWHYINPVGSFGAAAQGANPILNGVFRAMRYPAAYPGLAGRDLVPGNVLEITDQPLACELFPEPSCKPDLDGDYLVEVDDLLMLLTGFGCTDSCTGDLDDDGAVGIGDVLVLLSGIGTPCPY